MNTLVIVPLYPQYSISTSGSSLKLLEEIFYRERDVWGPNAGTIVCSLLSWQQLMVLLLPSEHKVSHTVVPAWYYRPGYVKVMAKLIINEIAQFTLKEMKEGILHQLIVILTGKRWFPYLADRSSCPLLCTRSSAVLHRGRRPLPEAD